MFSHSGLLLANRRGLLLALPLVFGCATPLAGGSDSTASGTVARATRIQDEAITSQVAVETFEKAWSAIGETHFDPDMNGVDWDAVHDELLPRAREAKTVGDVREVIQEMVGRLGQSHFAVLPARSAPDQEGAYDRDVDGGVGLDVRVREGRVLVSSVEAQGPAWRAGVRPGWVLLRSGSYAPNELPDKDDPQFRKRAYAVRQRIEGRLFGSIGEQVELELRNGDDETVTLDLTREKRRVEKHAFGDLPPFYLHFEAESIERDGLRIGRIQFSNWFLPVMQPLNKAVDRMRDHDGMILDLRGNGGGAAAMTMGIAGHFFTERVPLGTQKMRDGEFTYVAMPQLVNARGQRVEPFQGPLVILIDETSASSSEVFAGGMQAAGRAHVIGETSMGAVLPARTTHLPNGDAILHALGDFTTPDGRLLEGIGVVPDEPVPLTRAALLASGDPQLEAALRWIASQR